MKKKWTKVELIKTVKELKKIIRNLRYEVATQDTEKHVLKKFRSCKNILESVTQQQERI
jgi:ribosomal protein L29